MPDLPTLENLTAAQASRVLAAFGSVANYRARLRDWVVEEVQRAELRAIDEKANADKQAKQADIDSSMPAKS